MILVLSVGCTVLIIGICSHINLFSLFTVLVQICSVLMYMEWWDRMRSRAQSQSLTHSLTHSRHSIFEAVLARKFRAQTNESCERTNERTNARTNERADSRTDERTNERASARTDGRTNEQTKGRMHGRTDGRTNERTNTQTRRSFITLKCCCTRSANDGVELRDGRSRLHESAGHRSTHAESCKDAVDGREGDECKPDVRWR